MTSWAERVTSHVSHTQADCPPALWCCPALLVLLLLVLALVVVSVRHHSTARNRPAAASHAAAMLNGLAPTAGGRGRRGKTGAETQPVQTGRQAVCWYERKGSTCELQQEVQRHASAGVCVHASAGVCVLTGRGARGTHLAVSGCCSAAADLPCLKTPGPGKAQMLLLSLLAVLQGQLWSSAMPHPSAQRLLLLLLLWGLLQAAEETRKCKHSWKNMYDMCGSKRAALLPWLLLMIHRFRSPFTRKLETGAAARPLNGLKKRYLLEIAHDRQQRRGTTTTAEQQRTCDVPDHRHRLSLLLLLHCHLIHSYYRSVCCCRDGEQPACTKKQVVAQECRCGVRKVHRICCALVHCSWELGGCPAGHKAAADLPALECMVLQASVQLQRRCCRVLLLLLVAHAAGV